MKVSAIIPTYNRADWLQSCLDSVFSQSYSLHEVIVVDDGSTDQTKELLSEDSRLKYIRQENQGPSAARNHGAKVATGELLAFLDVDDRWEKKKIEKQVEFFSKHPEYKCCYTDEIWIRNGQRVNQHKHHYKISGWIYLDCLPLCRISPSSICIDTSFYHSLSGFREDFPVAEDYELWLRIAMREPIALIDEKLISKYGGHSDQLSLRWGIDHWRVQALKERFMDPLLKEEWKKATGQMLCKKLDLLEKGFRKRDKNKEADAYAEDLKKYKRLVN